MNIVGTPLVRSDNGPDAKAVFEILVREHADMLEAFLRSILRADSAIDDVFQETMLVAWRRLDDYDRSRPFGAWLRGIAQVLALEHARKARRRPMTTDPHILAEVDRRFEQLDKNPGDTFLDRTQRLNDCISRLPDAMRQAIDLVYNRSLSIAAAAVFAGAGEEAIKKRVQRARQLLAECMGIGDGDPAAQPTPGEAKP